MCFEVRWELISQQDNAGLERLKDGNLTMLTNGLVIY